MNYQKIAEELRRAAEKPGMRWDTESFDTKKFYRDLMFADGGYFDQADEVYLALLFAAEVALDLAEEEGEK